MRIKTVFLALLAVLILSACGNNRSQSLNGEVLRDFFLREPPVATTPEETAALVNTALRVLKEPVMLVILEDRKATAIMVPFGQNGPVETWTTEEFQSIAFHQGVVTATRGLGNDLMSAEVQQAARALRAGGGTVQRTWRTIDGTNAVVSRAATCRIAGVGDERVTLASGESFATQRFSEDCGDGIRNAYWLTSDGRIVQSRQWLGTEAGYLTQQLLRR